MKEWERRSKGFVYEQASKMTQIDRRFKQKQQHSSFRFLLSSQIFDVCSTFFVFILIKPNHKISAFSSLLYQHIPSQKMSKIDCFDKTFIELSTTDNTLHADRKGDV